MCLRMQSLKECLRVRLRVLNGRVRHLRVCIKECGGVLKSAWERVRILRLRARERVRLRAHGRVRLRVRGRVRRLRVCVRACGSA